MQQNTRDEIPIEHTLGKKHTHTQAKLTLHELRLHGRFVLLGRHNRVQLNKTVRSAVVHLPALFVPFRGRGRATHRREERTVGLSQTSQHGHHGEKDSRKHAPVATIQKKLGEHDTTISPTLWRKRKNTLWCELSCPFTAHEQNNLVFKKCIQDGVRDNFPVELFRVRVKCQPETRLRTPKRIAGESGDVDVLLRAKTKVSVRRNSLDDVEERHKPVSAIRVTTKDSPATTRTSLVTPINAKRGRKTTPINNFPCPT